MTRELLGIVKCFENAIPAINSDKYNLKSDEVLRELEASFEALDFRVEKGKRSDQKIRVPVLFGLNNDTDKEYNADAWSIDGRIVIEVEAGQATENNKFYKGIFQACLMHEVEYLVLAVRQVYRGHRDFEIIYTFLETLYLSGRVQLPLKAILLIGY